MQETLACAIAPRTHLLTAEAVQVEAARERALAERARAAKEAEAEEEDEEEEEEAMEVEAPPGVAAAAAHGSVKAAGDAAPAADTAAGTTSEMDTA